MGDGLVRMARLRERQAEIRLRLGIGWIERERAPEIGDRFVGAGAVRHHFLAEVIPRHPGCGIWRARVPVESCSVSKRKRAMPGKRSERDEKEDGRHC